jgi:hypothetical protein
MAETYVSASRTESLRAAIGNRRRSTESEAAEEESSSGARASSLSWVRRGGRGRGRGGGRAGCWDAHVRCGKGRAEQEGALGVRGLCVQSAHGDGVIAAEKLVSSSEGGSTGREPQKIARLG